MSMWQRQKVQVLLYGKERGKARHDVLQDMRG